MRRVVVTGVVAVFAFAVACLRSVSYECNDNTFCQHSGMQGTCETDKFCSYPDPACASGKRYGADGPNAGQCVGSGSGSGSGPFTIGGSATGVIGTGLVLLDNGSDMLAVGSNGPFTFAQKIANGSAYLVTVMASPMRETCKITNGSGTTAGANVTGVLAQCSTGNGGIGCGSSVCNPNNQVCCHDNTDTGGACDNNAGNCSGSQHGESCDDAGDCGGAPAICCARLTAAGSIKQAIACVGSAANCTVSGTDVAQYLCDPNAATPCPAGMTCVLEQTHGWFRCQ